METTETTTARYVTRLIAYNNWMVLDTHTDKHVGAYWPWQGEQAHAHADRLNAAQDAR